MSKKPKSLNKTSLASNQNSSLYSYGSQIIRNSFLNVGKEKRDRNDAGNSFKKVGKEKRDRNDAGLPKSIRGAAPPPLMRWRDRRPRTPPPAPTKARRSSVGDMDVGRKRCERRSRCGRNRCGTAMSADAARQHSVRRTSSSRPSVGRHSCIWPNATAPTSIQSAWHSSIAGSSHMQRPPRRISEVNDVNRHLMYGRFGPRPLPFHIRNKRGKHGLRSEDNSPVLSRLASPRSVYASLYSPESRCRRRVSCLRASLARLSRTAPIHMDIKPQNSPVNKGPAPVRQIRKMLVEDLAKTARQRRLY